MADYYEMLFLLLYLMLGLEFNLKCLSPVAAHLRAAGIHRWVNITDVSQTRGFAKNYNRKEPKNTEGRIHFEDYIWHHILFITAVSGEWECEILTCCAPFAFTLYSDI